MLTNREYLIHSLEFNLFFLRIAKEHTIFAAASLPIKNLKEIKQANTFKRAYENLLSQAVLLSTNDQITGDLINSGEFITPYTLKAETITSQLTGIPIETSITQQEIDTFKLNLPTSRQDSLVAQVSQLNNDAIALTTNVIAFQQKLISDVLSCKAFSYSYPLMLDHVTREAKLGVTILKMLQMKDTIDSVNEIIATEINGTDIMGEHSKFIRGYLDPSEKALIDKSNDFANSFEKLLAATQALEDNPDRLAQITSDTIDQVTQLRDFKNQSTYGILSCKIKSIIPPLLSDHVLREANYYLKLLRTFGASK